jgi:hypothetical protein
MKKIPRVKIDHVKHIRRLNLKLPKDRERLARYIDSNLTLSIFDFFYFMHLKSNYRGFRFIENISAQSTATYFGAYFGLGERVYRALRSVIQQLAQP